MTVQDRIEREIHIDAGIGRVWELVSQPGWWIGEGVDDGATFADEGEYHVVSHPKHGRVPIKVESVRPQTYVAFRWASAFLGADPVDGKATLVEFWLSERDGGTQVRVVESGFASLATSEDVRQAQFDGNTEGWRFELGLLGKRAVHASA
ncbi:MAG TPA: SRPBCC domain-containing protein [Pseudonocardiaceae bacterium]|nr:SRPBCC domain-containing protein [Pseudonocardiaceae bacterium]